MHNATWEGSILCVILTFITPQILKWKRSYQPTANGFLVMTLVTPFGSPAADQD